MKSLFNNSNRSGAWLASIFLAVIISALIGFSTGSKAERAIASLGARRNAKVMLLFNTMYGVDGAFVNSTAVRGVQSDELPWEVGGVQGYLNADGRLHISVRGLVFPNDPSVPENLRGINDETEFRALVSVLTDNGAGSIVTSNIVTQGFHATRTGNADINAKLDLPTSAVAPIVFIIGGDEEKWFAVTGAETGGEAEEK